MRTTKSLALSLLVACLGAGEFAWGCECIMLDTIEATFATEVKSAAVVFVGVATSRKDLDLGPHDRASELKMSGDELAHWWDQVQIEFLVSRVWKGEPVVFVRTMPGEGHSCGIGEELGQEYIIFAFRNPYDEALHMNLCSLSTSRRWSEKFATVLGLLNDWSR
jgi:hypothetical protein